MAATQSRTAPIWTYVEQTEHDLVICLTCKDTFNVIKPLRTKHPVEYAGLNEENDAGKTISTSKQPKLTIQPTLTNTFAKATPYKRGR